MSVLRYGSRCAEFPENAISASRGGGAERGGRGGSSHIGKVEPKNGSFKRVRGAEFWRLCRSSHTVSFPENEGSLGGGAWFPFALRRCAEGMGYAR
jgi:hypothetical protein